MLKCDNLSVTLGQKEIIRDVSFWLENGQNLLILGENGAGKSTLAKALCSLISCDGNISLFGKNTKNISGREHAKLINYISPKLHIFEDDITLLDYVLDGFFVHKNKFEPYTKDEYEQAKRALESFGLSKLLRERVRFLSSGEKQLAMIAQASLQNSRITIFDEPIANIDTKRAVTLFDTLLHNGDFHSKIVITHDLHFAYSLGFDILYLKDGQVDFFGKSSDFFDTASIGTRFNGAVRLFEGGAAINYEKI